MHRCWLIEVRPSKYYPGVVSHYLEVLSWHRIPPLTFPITPQGALVSSLLRLTPVTVFIHHTHRNGRGVMGYSIS